MKRLKRRLLYQESLDELPHSFIEKKLYMPFLLFFLMFILICIIISGFDDCLPLLKLNSTESIIKEECLKRSDYCSYQIRKLNAIRCFYDRPKSRLIMLDRIETNSFIIEGKTIDKRVQIDFEFVDENILRFRISPTEKYEFNKSERNLEVRDLITNHNYEIATSPNPNNFYFKIMRSETKMILWDSSVGPIIFNSELKQITTSISQNVSLLSHINSNINEENFSDKLYLFTGDETDNYGLLLKSKNVSNCEQISEKGVVFKTNDEAFDFYLFSGPNIESVLEQYSKISKHDILPFNSNQTSEKNEDNPSTDISNNILANDTQYLDQSI